MPIRWWGRAGLVAAFLGISLAHAQTLNNASLNGKYFFRHVSLSVDVAGNLADPRSLLGTITFDGLGHYSFAAQLVEGGGAPVPLTGSATYSVDPAGFVSLDSPARQGEKVNARLGPEALVGSATESAAGSYDLFIAVPAATNPVTVSSVNGSFWAVSWEVPADLFSNLRTSMFNLNFSGNGTIANFTVNGHAANLSSSTLNITGATYTVGSDGTVNAAFGPPSASALFSGNRTVYLSADGNVFIGGTLASGVHDVLIGVKAVTGASNASWSGPFWTTGLRHDSTAITSYVGSAVAGGAGSVLLTRRLKISGGVGNLDFTAANGYSLQADGSGTEDLSQVSVGAGGGAFVGTTLSSSDPSAYDIFFGSRMPPVSGTGLFLNPQGVQNVGSFAPTGNPIAPGELIYLYVSGLNVSPQSATPPYPASLGGVTVLINGTAAPLYQVTPTRLVAVVPYATQGPTANIQVASGGAQSNTVSVPLAGAAPGIFSQTQNGTGAGAIRHANYDTVTAGEPAAGGETVSVFLTGLGAVNPPLKDGFGGSANPLSNTVATPSVLIGGQPGTVTFSGMSSYPGLYQINVTVPPIPPGVNTLPLAIQVGSAFHDQVNIPVQP
ncbi:MAG TPA: hypothetical protein VJ732_07170 [Bryobacteraceae bacterium]|nr:hypothetical protein [Bryobacteraceae bacterium]